MLIKLIFENAKVNLKLIFSISLPLEDRGWLRTTIGVCGVEIMDGIWLWSATIVITFWKRKKNHIYNVM